MSAKASDMNSARLHRDFAIGALLIGARSHSRAASVQIFSPRGLGRRTRAGESRRDRLDGAGDRGGVLWSAQGPVRLRRRLIAVPLRWRYTPSLQAETLRLMPRWNRGVAQAAPTRKTSCSMTPIGNFWLKPILSSGNTRCSAPSVNRAIAGRMARGAAGFGRAAAKQQPAVYRRFTANGFKDTCIARPRARARATLIIKIGVARS